MNGIGSSLVFAIGNAVHPRMLWLMLWPVLIALALWGTVLAVFGAQLAVSLAQLLHDWVSSAPFVARWDMTDALLVTAKVMVWLMLLPLVQVTALLILGVFGMPAMVEHVAGRRFPQLARRHGGSFAGSVHNSVVAIAGMIGLGIASLPLWIFPPLWPVIPVAVLAWVNQRVLRYDALAEHADAGEMQDIFRARRRPMYVLGVLLALVAYVPLLGFFAPVIVGLAFIHFLLSALEGWRRAPIEGEVIGR